MMEKLLHFEGTDQHGSPFTQLLTPGDGFEKTAASLNLSDDIREFMAHLKPEPGHTYVLNNALGAEEIYGSNINGDGFPAKALLNGHEELSKVPSWDVEGRKAVASTIKFGYPTFYTAHIFQHHVNKDPSKTLGKIILATWNAKMRRVEVIFDLDHSLCEGQGAMDLINKIEAGNFPSTSMGCKVPYDRCSICGNLAKTRAQYCQHVNNKDPRYGMNKILPDGRRAYVHNDHPRFFDDSFVVIGADKTAFVMAKLAGKANSVFTESGAALPSALRGELFYGQQELEKAASVEKTALSGALRGRAARVAETRADALLEAARKNPGVRGLVPAAARRSRQAWYFASGRKVDSSLAERAHAQSLGVTVAGPRASAKATSKTERALGIKKTAVTRNYVLDRMAINAGNRLRDYAASHNQLGMVRSEMYLSAQKLKPAFKRRGWPAATPDEMRVLGDRAFQAAIGEKVTAELGKGGRWGSTIKKAGVPFLEQDRPEKVKDVYQALKRDHPDMPEEVKARIAARKGKKSAKSRKPPETGGPAHKAPLTFKRKGESYVKKAGLGQAGTFFAAAAGLGAVPGALAGAGLGLLVDADVPTSAVLGSVGAGAGSVAGLVHADKTWKRAGNRAQHLKLQHGFGRRIGPGYMAAGAVLGTVVGVAAAKALSSLKKEAEAAEPGEATRATVLEQLATEKLAREEKEAAQKISEILKKLPAGTASILKGLENDEPDIPNKVLDGLAGAPSLRDALSAPTAMGMVLKPREFQRVVLVHSGRRGLADDYDNRRVAFRPHLRPHCGCLPFDKVGPPAPSILHMLRPLLEMIRNRSVASPVMEKRITLVFMGRPPAAKPVTEESDPVLDKLATAYSDYRYAVINSIPDMAESFEIPTIKTAILSEQGVDLGPGIKQSSVPAALKLLALVGPLIYLSSAHLRTRHERGEDLGPLDRLVMKHPTLLTALAVGGGGRVINNPKGALRGVQSAIEALRRGPIVP